MSTRDPLDIAAREEEELAAKKRQDLLTRYEAEDIKWLMSDKRGRRIMWRLLEATGLYRSSFAGNDTNSAMFREGERNVGLRHIALVHAHSPEKYALMTQEQIDHERSITDQVRQ
jgi:hypothetical protein